jgi:hypothetical protein
LAEFEEFSNWGESCIFNGMSNDLPISCCHPLGDQPSIENPAWPAGVNLDTFAGNVHVEWDPSASMTPLGQLPFFIEYLKVSGLFDAFVADCPLHYTSPNAPKKRDVLGTVMLSALAGHRRYAHISGLRSDGVLPELLGMNKVVSEDAVRRALKTIDQDEGAAWLQSHLDHCTMPLLGEPWILDIDTTVKPLYGHQEGAAIGYNPKKPGRPSHVYHTYAMGGTRLVLDVEVTAGNEHGVNYTAPALWKLLDRLGRDLWPALLRGDKAFGCEPVMREAEARHLPYLFKLRQTANVKRLIEKLFIVGDWENVGHGWQAAESSLRLVGWSRHRRVVVLRRRVSGALATSMHNNEGQMLLGFAEGGTDRPVFEYAVHVTSLEEELVSFGQLYRDRADAENIFDELKNQWGWGGFTTRDLARCQLIARQVALFYDWWNIFARLAEPDRHMEAITSRPLLLHAIAARVRHARQTTLRVASSHGKALFAANALTKVAGFLSELIKTAEQLTSAQRWCRILSRAFQSFLKGRLLRPPRLAAA